MKEQMIAEMTKSIMELGVTAQNGNGADITIQAELLDAGWSTGSKKITYEAAVFANEQEEVVYMFEKTTEVGHGLSFGGESGSSFQSGTTLFRKVKSVQYGPDGKAYEYTLNLGAIPKAVKETAKEYGWKFKTVLNRNKAMYPPGYVPTRSPQVPSGPTMSMNQVQQSQEMPAEQQPVTPATPTATNGFCTNCGMPLSIGAKFCDKCGKPVGGASPQNTSVSPPPKQNSTSEAFHTEVIQKGEGRKGGVAGSFGLIGFILLGVVTVLMLFAGSATLTGWGISAVIFGVAFFLQRRLKKKGCVLNLILWSITAFALLVTMIAFSSDSLRFTSANVKNAHMTTAIDAAGKPADTVTSYAINAPQLIASAELHNAPVDTKVKFVWTYVTGNIPITEFVVDSANSDANVYVFSNLTNDKPWPEGKYRVEIHVENREKPDATIEFDISTKKTSASNMSTEPVWAAV